MIISVLKYTDFDSHEQYLEVADYFCLMKFGQGLVVPETRFPLFFAVEVSPTQTQFCADVCDLLEKTVFGKSPNLSDFGHFMTCQITFANGIRLSIIAL